MDQEKKNCNVSFFVTFTYDDENLCYANDGPCLCKSDFQLYMKRLRKRLEPRSLKYFCVGEYGDQWRPITPNGRPHYHALMFYYGYLDRFRLALLIHELWTFGIVQVLPVQGAQGYVTKYVLKFDKREHEVKPFSMISHGLGIGYLTDQMIAYHRKDLVPYAMKPGGYRISLPRYYKDKIFSMIDKLIMKKRADLYRRELDMKQADYEDLCMKFGRNPFVEEVENYKVRLYNAMKVYRNKKKL